MNKLLCTVNEIVSGILYNYEVRRQGGRTCCGSTSFLLFENTCHFLQILS